MGLFSKKKQPSEQPNRLEMDAAICPVMDICMGECAAGNRQ